VKVLQIAWVNAKRILRDRVATFFLFVFPIILILLIGVSFGGSFTPRLGVVSGPSGHLSGELRNRLGEIEGVEIERFTDAAELIDAVERGRVEAGVIIPNGYDAELTAGETADVGYVARPGDLSFALRTSVDSVVADQASLVRAAHFGADHGLGDFDAALAATQRVAEGVPDIEVATRTVAGDEAADETVGRFDLGAASQLVLFVFVNSLAAAVALIQSRQLGVSRRMLSTPMRARTIVLGEGLGRFVIAMLQSIFIVIASALLFGVNWGDPVGASVLMVSFALVSTGAAMLLGSLLSNEEQAGAIGTPVGLILAALGGCMVPLEIFSPTMQTIAHITPHAWAVEGFTKLVELDAGLGDILTQVLVLLGFATVLLTIASISLRRAVLG
jgi:ABC-2 type transport system permease protein